MARCRPPARATALGCRWGHGVKQTEYGDWKASLFANVPISRSVNAKAAVFHDVQPMPELAELREAVYIGGKKVLSEEYLKRLTPLSLALWYQDDALVLGSGQGPSGPHRRRQWSGRDLRRGHGAGKPSAAGRLPVRHLGHLSSARRAGAAKKAVLVFPKDETAKLHALIAPFVHPSMAYKLLPKYQGRFAVEPVFVPTRDELAALPITKIAVKPPTRSMHRFDIEVEGSHNYFADGVMVHNSPETTPGGRALKFYSSVRLDIRRIESIKDGTEVVGNRTRVKVVKNKVSPPFRQAEFDIMYGKGISREGSLLDLSVDLGIVKKSGAWFTYDGEQLGQGRENAKVFLAENPEIMVEISDRVLQQAGLGDAPRGARGLHPGRRGAHRAGMTPGDGGGTGRCAAPILGLPMSTRSYVIRTFGCQMNEHDSERIAGLLEDDGLVLAASVDDADVVVLNTCCIRENADNKLYGNLGQLKRWKEVGSAEGRDRQIVVAGCLAQKDRDLVRGQGALRRCRARHPQRAPRRGAHRGVPPAGPITEILDEAVADDHAHFPSALPARTGDRLQRLGHDPDRLRQLVRLLHRALGAGQRRSAGPSPTSWPRSKGWPPTASPR